MKAKPCGGWMVVIMENIIFVSNTSKLLQVKCDDEMGEDCTGLRMLSKLISKDKNQCER